MEEVSRVKMRGYGKIQRVTEATSQKLLLNNRYQLEGFVEKGGMATVYRGRDLMLERDVAIKVLREDYSRDPAFRERFRQEAKAAANLSHSNIVTVHDFGYDEDHLFIVMEYIPGTDLHSLIKKKGRYTVEEGIPLVVQACKGVGYAHRAGLVHCDIKPHNFLVTPDKRLKVTDFGIARALASIHPSEEQDVVWGSPQYFSPEQAAGNAPSPASDVYGIGVIMFQMFTGQLPFTAKTADELANQHRFINPTPPIEINPEIPPALNEIMLKVLSKEPSARYRTADQLGRVLLTFAAPEDVAAIEAFTPEPEPIEGNDGSKPRKARLGRAARDSEDTDWLAVGLGLLAALLVGGLLPFWMWVYLVFNPPLR
jgi:serine/threonine-protein kinase